MPWWALMLGLLFFRSNVGQPNENLELFWNLYSAVVKGSRILHDITEGAGAVSKAIRAIDLFFDGTEEEPTNVDEFSVNADTVSVDNDSPNKVSDPPTTPTTSPNEPVLEVNSKTDPKVIPQVFNGCGALGFHIRNENLPVGKMTECCTQHDACYRSSCKAFKKECDSKLRNCLFAQCDPKKLDKVGLKNCKSAAHLLFSGTMALSFQQFNEAQSGQTCKVYKKTEPRKSNP